MCNTTRQATLRRYTHNSEREREKKKKNLIGEAVIVAKKMMGVGRVACCDIQHNQ